MNRMIVSAAALAASLALAAPGYSQALPADPGSYWDVSAVEVEDGQDAAYLDFLAANWKQDQEFAKSKGYIKAYHVLTNDYPRKGEPDMYLITIYDKWYDTPEQQRQQREYEEYKKKDTRKLIAESGGRAKMRTVTGTTLLREWVFKK